jgi:uncharacterized protein YjbI with pentapeptide repeats
MANEEHVDLLRQGVAVWNQWRKEHPHIRPDLSEIDLTGVDLKRFDLSSVNLTETDLTLANLSEANLAAASLFMATLVNANLRGADFILADLTSADLTAADLVGADLSNTHLGSTTISGAEMVTAKLTGAHLIRADLSRSNLSRADLSKADLSRANLNRANLSGANLRGAVLNRTSLRNADLSTTDLAGANLVEADLTGANLSFTCLAGANLSMAILSEANLTSAQLRGANLSKATLVETNLTNADMSGCSVYGTSAWNVRVEGANQSMLIVTVPPEPPITVDNLETGQFIYLLLYNPKFRDVLDCIVSKMVLILGRFTLERKAVLDAIKNELYMQNYLPMMFDFEQPRNRDIVETISILAHLSRFIIADLTDPASISQELQAIIPQLLVPVQPILQKDCAVFASFSYFSKYHWVLPILRYEDLADLLASLKERVIAPAEKMAIELEKQKIFHT